MKEVDDVIEGCLHDSKRLYQRGKAINGRRRGESDQQIQQQLDNYHGRQGD